MGAPDGGVLDGVGSPVTGGDGRVVDDSGREVVGPVVVGREGVGVLGPGAEVVRVAGVGDATVLGRVGAPVGVASPGGGVEVGRGAADGAPGPVGVVEPGAVVNGTAVADDVLPVGVVPGAGALEGVLCGVVGEAGVASTGPEAAAVDGVVVLGEFGPGVSAGTGASVADAVCTDCCAW